MVKASIIVLNFNGRTCIRDTLVALRNQTYKDVEIILVDNQSTDDSPDIVRKEFPEVKFIQNAINGGICQGYNLGIQHAKGEYLGTIANDMILDKDWLKYAIAAFENDSSVAVVGCYVEYDEGYYKGARVYGFFLDLMANPYPINDKPKGYVFGTNGTLLKRSILGDTPYDTAGLYFFADDVYIGWKTILTGHKVASGDKVTMRHIGRVAAKTVPDFIDFHAEKDRFLSPLIFYDLLNLIKIAPLLFLSMFTDIVVSTFKGKVHVRLKSYFWLAKNFKRIWAERQNIQKQRKVTDKEIFKYMTYKTPYPLGILTPIAQKFLWLYCASLRIPTREFQKSRAH